MLTSINRTSVTKLLLPQNNNVWTTQHFRLIQLVLMLFILFMFVIKDGFHGDTSRMFSVGKVAPHAERLAEVTKEAMWQANVLNGGGMV